MITLHRKSSYADAIRAYDIVIDGNVSGKIKRGETVSLNSISQGDHQIWIKIDWCRSNKLDFSYDGTTTHFECGSNLKGLKLFLSIVYIFIPDKWCWIKKAEQGAAANP